MDRVGIAHSSSDSPIWSGSSSTNCECLATSRNNCFRTVRARSPARNPTSPCARQPYHCTPGPPRKQRARCRPVSLRCTSASFSARPLRRRHRPSYRPRQARSRRCLALSTKRTPPYLAGRLASRPGQPPQRCICPSRCPPPGSLAYFPTYHCLETRIRR